MTKIKTNLNYRQKNYIQKYFCQSIFRQLGNKYKIGIFILKPIFEY